MAKIRGQLQFPINEAKNPAFSQNRTQNVPNQLPPQPPVKPIQPQVKSLSQPVVPLAKTPVKPLGVPEQTKATVAPINEVTPVETKMGLSPDNQITPVETKAVVTPTQQVTPLGPTQTKAVVKPVTELGDKIPTEVRATTEPIVRNEEVGAAQISLDDLSIKAANAMNATNDPIAITKFNQALSNVGLFNQAQRDLMQQQINNNPDLVGQPAGTAMLSMLARQQGADVSNLITNLSVESANRVRELNKWGFDKYANIVSFRETQKANIRSELLAAGDFDGYANIFREDTGISIDVSDMREMSAANQSVIATQQDLLTASLRSGDLEAARKHFDTIVALAPNSFKGATFDSLGFADKSYVLSSLQNDEISKIIRMDVAQGEIGKAIKGLETLHSEEERIEGGASIIAEKSIEEINEALEAAGFETITDKSELIGREDEVFTAVKINEIVNKSNRTPIDEGVDFFVKHLRELNPGIILDEDDMRIIRSFSGELLTGGEMNLDAQGNVSIDPNELIKPWESGSPTENNFRSWPMMGESGNITEPSEFYTESNPEPTPDSEIGKYNADLDQKWARYKQNTPKNEWVSMKAWFLATKAGNFPFDDAAIPPGEKGGKGEELPGTFGGAIKTNKDLEGLATGEWEKLLDNPKKLIELEKSGALKRLSFSLSDLNNMDKLNSLMEKNEITIPQIKHDGKFVKEEDDKSGSIIIYTINGVPTPVRLVQWDSRFKGTRTTKNNRALTLRAVNLLTNEPINLINVQKNASGFEK